MSSITPRVSRNTLNHAFDPTAGSLQELSRGGRGPRRRAVPQDRGPRALVLHVPALEVARRLHLLDRRARSATASATTGSTATSCRSSSATSRAASTRSAASRRGPSARARCARTSSARSIDTTPIGGSQQLIFNNEIIFPIVAGHRPEGRRLRRRRQRLQRRRRHHHRRDAGLRPAAACAGFRRSGRARSSSAMPLNSKPRRPGEPGALLVRRTVSVLRGGASWIMSTSKRSVVGGRRRERRCVCSRRARRAVRRGGAAHRGRRHAARAERVRRRQEGEGPGQGEVREARRSDLKRQREDLDRRKEEYERKATGAEGGGAAEPGEGPRDALARVQAQVRGLPARPEAHRRRAHLEHRRGPLRGGARLRRARTATRWSSRPRAARSSTATRRSTSPTRS